MFNKFGELGRFPASLEELLEGANTCQIWDEIELPGLGDAVSNR